VRRALCLVAAVAFAGAALVGAAAVSEFTPVEVRAGDTLWSISQKYLKDPKAWDQILKHNKLPTSDPTVALPGMTLRVPTGLLKQEYQAAELIQSQREVMSRKKDSAAWDGAREGKLLYDGDGLRTMSKAFARVRFFGGALLTLEQDSMAILKSPKKSDYDLQLNRGSAVATFARVITPSARVTPKSNETKYKTQVMDDLSTRVQVYTGAADVADVKGLKKVEVHAGFYTDVPLDRMPSVPVKMPKGELAMQAPDVVEPGRPDTRIRQAGSPDVPGGEGLAATMKQLSVGLPVAAYNVQVSRDRQFGKILLDRTFDSYQTVDLRAAGLPNGRYWVRVAVVDLLGDKGRFSEPKPYVIGPQAEAESLAFQDLFDVTRPAQEATTVKAVAYRIMGRAAPSLKVLINGERVGRDEDGNFSVEVRLQKGANKFRIEASDVRGNNKTLYRTITLQAQQ